MHLLFCYQSNALCVSLYEFAVTLYYARYIWPGADGIYHLYLPPFGYHMYCKRKRHKPAKEGRCKVHLYTKSQMTTPEPGIEPGSTWWEAGSPPTTPSALAMMLLKSYLWICADFCVCIYTILYICSVYPFCSRQ
jgi:hypothetical protein